MVKVDLVLDRIRRLRETGEALLRVLPTDDARLAQDRDVRDLVSFRVYLIAQEANHVAAHVITDQGWGPTTSLHEHFSTLAARAVVAPDLAERWASAIKVRNLIGHGYAAVDPAKLHAAARELAGLIDPFCAAVLAFAEANAT